MNSACRVTSALMEASAAGPATGTIVWSISGLAVGMVCWVMLCAKSACATWVIRTSCAPTIEMPTDPPILRDEVEQRGAGRPHTRGQGFERQRLQRHEDQAEAEALDDPADDHRPRRLVDRKAGHHPQRDAHQHDADPDQQPRIDLAHQPPGEQHRDQRADPARRGQEARLEHRIAVEILQQRREQGEAGEQAARR